MRISCTSYRTRRADSAGQQRQAAALLGAASTSIDPLQTRKIFLDTHKRFYLVVCQIHCDAPGFPRATREDVCDAGFVVRRRTTDIPAARGEAKCAAF